MIFDLDGTLIDSIGCYNDIDKELIIKCGGTPRLSISSDRDHFLAANTSGDIYLNYAKYLQESYNLSISGEEINILRNEMFKDYINKKVCLKPHAGLFLKELKARDYTLLLATISSKWVVDIYMKTNPNIKKECDLIDIFGNNVLTKDDVKQKKPNPEIYYKSLEKLGSNIKPNQCMVFEDSLSGIIAALNAGIEVTCIYDKYADVDRYRINELTTYSADNYDQLITNLSEKGMSKTLKMK